jgi:hypothetical protein
LRRCLLSLIANSIKLSTHLFPPCIFQYFIDTLFICIKIKEFPRIICFE